LRARRSRDWEREKCMEERRRKRKGEEGRQMINDMMNN